MARYIAALALLGAVLADGTGHHHTDHGAAAAPSAGGYAAPAASYGAPADTGYAAPQAAYGAPTYDAPSTGYEQPAGDYAAPSYDAPATGYGEPTGYDAPSYAAADAVNDFDLSQITELLPLFVAVFAAIIIAQLVAPLFSMLFNAKLGLLGGVFNPVRQAKADLINAVLNPLGFRLGSSTDGTCASNIVFPAAGRSLPYETMGIIDMISVARNVYESKINTIHNSMFDHCASFALFSHARILR